MKVIRTKKYLPILQQIANSYNFPLEAIEITDDIQQWCSEHGLPENSPFRAGKCVFNSATKKHRVLLRAEITEEIQQSIIGKMDFSLKAFTDKITDLNNKKYFLIHLILHEIAHAKHNEWSESCCDEWAFKEMRQWTKYEYER